MAVQILGGVDLARCLTVVTVGGRREEKTGEEERRGLSLCHILGLEDGRARKAEVAGVEVIAGLI